MVKLQKILTHTFWKNNLEPGAQDASKIIFTQEVCFVVCNKLSLSHKCTLC